jgi:ABC-type multidrug transport system ATPase subunit
MSLGLWKLSEKMNWEKRWMAWVPGLRYYALADSMEMRTEGIGCGILEILYYLMMISPAAFDDHRQLVVEALISLSVVIALYVYRIRIFMRLILLFDLKRRWLILWLLAEWVTLLFLGFDKRYQPHPEVSFQTGWEAGMEPAQITGVSDAMNAATASRKGLSVHLRERTARELGKKKYLLKDIAMNIPNGSLVLLLGGSGAGKTTFMNAVIGYEKADADIYLNGTNVYKQYNKMKYRIGFVTQMNLVRTHDTVFRTISDAAKLRMPLQVKAEKRKKRVEEVMDLLGLTPVASGLVSKMSGGQLRRISIAIELVSDPELFVLDEPDSGLDGVIARELFEKLKEISDTGKIVIVITHTPDRVIDLFDKVIILAKDSGRVGRLAFYGSPDEAREFFGRDTMEDIVQCVNRSEEGGEGLADEYIEKYARSRIDSSEGQNKPEKPAEEAAEEKDIAEAAAAAADQVGEEVSPDEE